MALLRVLQEREFERVGGTEIIRTNVRVIAATHRDLHAAINAGKFRSDLFYRLNVFPMEVPPLRERKEDIAPLATFFVERSAIMIGKSIRGIDPASMKMLMAHSWPGNIRELQNVIERSVITCESEVLRVDEGFFPRELRPSKTKTQRLAVALAEQEREIIEEALRECRGRVAGPWGAAARLGMPPSTLESKILTLKIDKYRFKSVAMDGFSDASRSGDVREGFTKFREFSSDRGFAPGCRAELEPLRRWHGAAREREDIKSCPQPKSKQRRPYEYRLACSHRTNLCRGISPRRFHGRRLGAEHGKPGRKIFLQRRPSPRLIKLEPRERGFVIHHFNVIDGKPLR